MSTSEPVASVQPEVLAHDESAEPNISEPTKLIRLASMTKAMLDEVRQAPPDEGGRRRLLQIHERSMEQLRSVVSDGLRRELDGIFLPLRQQSGPPSESELRLAQAQLVGWLEGLFHGIQASLYSQHAAAQRQVLDVRSQSGGEPGDQGDYPGVYL